jgi:Ca2+-binding RTX toxin-like protein
VQGTGSRRAISTALLAAVLFALLAGSSEAKPRCHGHKATVVGGRGANHLRGTAGPDVIVGGAGGDRIDGHGGFDLICGRSGADTILGGPGGDTLLGGSGDDSLYGGLQDDKLVGASGDDLLIGGEAPNTLVGGPGDDYSRDGFNVNGGPGSDWISYATRTFHLNDTGFSSGIHSNPHGLSLENVVGTRFKDVIYASTAGAGMVRGLGSLVDPLSPEIADECYGFAITQCDGSYGPIDQPIVLLDSVQPDPGLTVMGGPDGDQYSISKTADEIRVVGPPNVAAGSGCATLGGGKVSCPLRGRLGYVFALGMEGDDNISIEGGLGPTTSVVMDGGGGGDTLRGGPEDDEFSAGFEDYVVTNGPNGTSVHLVPSPDTLIGGGGDDSLTAGYDGPDRLYGGPGTDQLATWSACSGGVFEGGPGGSDIANFVSAGEVRARLGGVAMPLHHYPGGSCTGPIRLAASTEFLEGSAADDVLIGNGRSNFIAGHEGDDVIKGMGGNDNLVGEGGHDRLIGGGGSDHLDCGAGGGVARRDGKDPRPRGCH